MIALEEKFLVNILYRPASEILNGVDITNINFEKLITLASGHLMLPALFFNIQKKKASYLFPEDFIDYIKNIFAINKARNEILLAEAKGLSQLLVENNINHIFLKGTALLLSNVFEDIGERMIGDIDFIIQHKDEENIKKVLEKNKYSSKKPYNSSRFFRHRHLPKTTHENKIIAIEAHLELLEAKNRWIYSSKVLINNFKKGIKTIKTPSSSFLFDHCIYNFQLNDAGFINSNHSHRSIYDIYKLDYKNSLRIKNIKKDIFIKHFFLSIAKFKIFDIAIKANLWSFHFDKLCMVVISNICMRYLQILELFVSNSYRKYALNKIINYFYKRSIKQNI